MVIEPKKKRTTCICVFYDVRFRILAQYVHVCVPTLIGISISLQNINIKDVVGMYMQVGLGSTHTCIYHNVSLNNCFGQVVLYCFTFLLLLLLPRLSKCLCD